MKASLKKWMAKVANYFNCDQLCSGNYSSGSIALSKSIANYKKLLIIAHDNDGIKKSFELITEGASSVVTYLDFFRITGTWYGKSMILVINGATASINSNAQAHSGGVGSGSYVYLEKIYGCKSIVGGGYCVTQLLQRLQRFSHRSCLGVM